MTTRGYWGRVARRALSEAFGLLRQNVTRSGLGIAVLVVMLYLVASEVEQARGAVESAAVTVAAAVVLSSLGFLWFLLRVPAAMYAEMLERVPRATAAEARLGLLEEARAIIVAAARQVQSKDPAEQQPDALEDLERSWRARALAHIESTEGPSRAAGLEIFRATGVSWRPKDPATLTAEQRLHRVYARMDDRYYYLSQLHEF